MMTKQLSMPDWADLGAKMKWMATVAVSASAFLGACATSAIGEETKGDERREIVISDSQIVVSDGDGERHVVRMVVESEHGDGEETDLCVFVPAGDDAGGALSCPGGNVRVFQFGPGHGRQIIVGDEVVDEEEIRRLVEARVAEANARLAERGAWEVEVIERFNSVEFQREMRELEREMQELQRVMQVEFRESEDMSAEERAEFEEAMRELGEEMAELGEMNFHVAPIPPHPGASHGMHWVSEDGHMGRNVIRINRDGEEHVTIIENVQDEDGNPRLVIRTTDPDSVEVVRIDPDELDDEDDD